jgi:acyl carrier protein
LVLERQAKTVGSDALIENQNANGHETTAAEPSFSLGTVDLGADSLGTVRAGRHLEESFRADLYS